MRREPITYELSKGIGWILGTLAMVSLAFASLVFYRLTTFVLEVSFPDRVQAIALACIYFAGVWTLIVHLLLIVVVLGLLLIVDGASQLRRLTTKKS